MGHKVATAVVTPQASTGVFPSPRAQKVSEERARLTPDDPQVDTYVSELIFASAKAVYGKVETAAAEVKKDRSNFTRDMRKLAELLEGLGPVVCAHVGAGLVKAYGVEIETPQQYGNRLCDTMQAELNQIRQVINDMAVSA